MRIIRPILESILRGCFLALPCTVTAQTPVWQLDEMSKSHMPSINAIGAGGCDVAVEDFDKDGHPDLVLALPTNDYVLFNDRRGRFASRVTRLAPQRSGLPSLALATGDVNGDGLADVFVGEGPNPFLPSNNRLYLNNGASAFTEVTKTHLPVDRDWTSAAALGDVDGDGDLDLVTANGFAVLRVAFQNRLYLNGGKGRFTDATSTRMPTALDTTVSLLLADIDADKDLDLIFGNTSGEPCKIYLNNGKGVFSDSKRDFQTVEATNAMALADVDSDGDPDLLTGNGLLPSYKGVQDRLYLNDGKGVFSDATLARMPKVSEFTSVLELGDIDRDGDADVVLGHPVGRTSLYLNDGRGTFSDATAHRLPLDLERRQGLVLEDLDRDGDPDIVVIGGNTPPRLFVNDGKGFFINASSATRYVPDTAFGAIQSACLADLDGEGSLDLVYATDSHGQFHYVNDGKGEFRGAPGSGLSAAKKVSARTVVAGDVDRDGDNDLVFGATFQTQTRLFLNDGKGTFTDVTATHLPASRGQTHHIALLDVDGDGDLDLLLANFSKQNRLFENDGKGRYRDVTATNLPVDADASNWVVGGDVDQDGDLDLVWGNGDLNVFPNKGRQNKLYLGDGKGKFSDNTSVGLPKAASNTESLVLGDVDQDGDLDLVTANSGVYLGEQNKLLLNDGKGKFSDATSGRLPLKKDQTKTVMLGDFDEDGDLDLFVADTIYGHDLYVNDGKGVYSKGQRVNQWVIQRGVTAAGDIDLDGDLDVVLGRAVLFNRHRHLSSPFVAVPGKVHALVFHASPGYLRATANAILYLNVLGLRRGIRVPPFGVFRLSPVNLIATSPIPIPAPAGKLSFPLPIPNTPVLRFLRLHAQALILTSKRLVDARLTSFLADRIAF
ncbi:MAG: FG-GAP repeat domain-containing protein [Planctomycetota bacterium]